MGRDMKGSILVLKEHYCTCFGPKSAQRCRYWVMYLHQIKIIKRHQVIKTIKGTHKDINDNRRRKRDTIVMKRIVFESFWQISKTALCVYSFNWKLFEGLFNKLSQKKHLLFRFKTKLFIHQELSFSLLPTHNIDLVWQRHTWQISSEHHVTRFKKV